MENARFSVRGRVVDDATDVGLTGLRVVAVDADKGRVTILLTAHTGTDGWFTFEVGAEEAAAFFRFPCPGDTWNDTRKLHISVFNGETLLNTFHEDVALKHFSTGRLPNELRVTIVGTAALTFTIAGRVVDKDRAGQSGVDVTLYRVEVDASTSLGTVVTNASGEYAIEYAGHDASTIEDPAMSLRVIATESAVEVGRTPIIFSPRPEHRADVVVGQAVYRGRSEYDRIAAALAPHLGETLPETLVPDSIELLAQRADAYPPHLAMHVQAARLSAAHAVDATTFYALLRAGMPADLPGLLSQSRSARRGALRRAYAERILPDPTSGTVEEAIDAALQAVDALVVDASLAEPGVGETNLRGLLDTSGLNETQLRDFMELRVPFQGSNADFWAAVHADTNLQGAPAQALEFTVEASVLVRSFLPALDGLQTLRTAETISTVADLAAWDVSEWLTFIGSNGGAPDDLPGETSGEREQLYAETMTRIIEERYPTQVLARRIERDDPASTTGVAAFLDDNPDFDVARTVIPIYLDANPASPPIDPQVEANIKTVQRVWSLTPRFNRYDVTQVLLDAGITSASRIVEMGPGGFAGAVATQLDGVHPVLDGQTMAAHLYKTAVVKNAGAQMLLMQYSAAANQVEMGPVRVPALPSEGPGVPTLEELMGSLDFCACEHCRSMLSPAAYFVELLARLDRTSALDELETRREDLRLIELSCVNTNTVLPYIDLVNELLEHVATTGSGSTANMPAHQTTWTAAELRRFPEWRNAAAYSPCATAVYPWSLPMDLPSVEQGLYLGRLGVGRHEMMRGLQRPAGTDPTADAIVAEALGMTTFERDVVVGTEPGSPVDLAAPWNLAGANFSDQIRTDLRRLLDTVGLELDGLLRLLAMRFIVPQNQQPEQWLHYENDEPSCNLEDITLDEAFDDDAADRLHRFLRLSHKTGLSWAELDTALRLRGERRSPSQDEGVLDEAFLAELVHLLWLRSRLGLRLVEVVAISSRIETHNYEGAPSLYSRLFLSKADPDGNFTLSGEQLPPDVDLAEEHYDTIRAGIRVHAVDLERLIAELFPVSPAPDLDTTNLSILYAHATLARALGVRVDQLFRLLALVDVDPFADPAQTVRFVEVADEIAASPMSVEQLDYLFRHRFDEASGVHPSDEDVLAVLQKIANGLAALETELATVAVEHPEPRDQLLAHLEAVFSDQQMIIDWMRILGEEGPEQPGDQDTLEDAVESVGMVSGFVAQVLDASPYPDYDLAIASFEEFRRERGQNAVIDEALAEATGLSPEAAGVLARTQALVEITTSSPGTVQAALVDPAVDQVDKIPVYRRVHKAAMIVVGLEIPAADLLWYFDFQSDAGTPQALDLNALPLAATDDGSEHMARWRRVALGQALQDSFTSAHNPLPAIGADDPAQDLQPVIDRLVEHTVWDREDVAFLLGAGLLQLPDPVDPGLKDPRLVARVRDVIELVRRTGVRAAVLADWAREEPTSDFASAARRALKARHAESAWPDVIVPLTDALRERQRDALVAYIVQTNGWFEHDIALFNALLVDPQMNACMLTSRIRLALSSVQLFIQRLLLGFETADIPERLPADWPWLRIYRIWEANRKVFFWPENWAEPELRDDKTPFFRELEEQVDQGPLDERQLERAFADYLYKLHEVSHLDIVAIYEETVDQIFAGVQSQEPQFTAVTVLHVVGRTRSEPRKHFYRRRDRNRVWTPWEEIPCDIPVGQVVLAVHNRRLFLIWGERREQPGEQAPGEESPGPERSQFQLSWSERRWDEWSEPRISEVSKAPTPPLVGTDVWQTLFLSTVNNGVDLRVDVVWMSDPAVVFATFVYNDCLDRFQEDANAYDHAWEPKHVGLPTWNRRVFEQQQLTFINLPSFDLFDDVAVNLTKTLLEEPGSHRVTLTHQYPLLDFKDPLIFDNDEHQFLVERADVSGSPLPTQVGWGWDATALIPQPISEPTEEPAPPSSVPFDALESPSPWAGHVPGPSTTIAAEALLLHHAQVDDGSFALAVLQDATATAQASTDLTLQGGGVNATSNMDPVQQAGYRLSTFYHPYTCLMRSELNKHGVDGLLAPTETGLKRQQVVDDHEDLGFTAWVAQAYPLDDFDFSVTAPYGVYNWELFYHVPLYIAERLRREQRFEEAMRWYHYIFDPLGRTALPDDEGAERYWNVKWLYLEAKNEVPDIIKAFFSGGDLTAFESFSFVASAAAWIRDPFNPHAIARWRLGTYRWVVLQRYLDNLIDWADSLFRRDTIESINEATQLYLLAAQILGPRPRPLPAITAPVRTYDELIAPEFFGGLAALEDFVPTGGGAVQIDDYAQSPAPAQPLWWYFCLPPNEKLLAYWDTVADRLFKIRNCQNIEGVRRALALFDPPIDPALLIKAKAAGLDLGAVIADLQAPLPHHRYRLLAARALELVGDVRALGSALQQALERKDAERLQELRATHEVGLLEAVRRVREAQVEEAEENRKVLDEQQALAADREQYYATREGRSGKEKRQLNKLKLAMGLMIGAESVKLVGKVLQLVLPWISTGTEYQRKRGGELWGSALDVLGDGLAMGSAIVRDQANMIQINAGYDRRRDDWKFQEGQAKLEQKHVEQQMVAAEIRKSIVSKELENHHLQIEQSRGIEEFLRTRYTNEQLYNWLVGQISTLYFQSYKLAYDLAKKAERAMRYELGDDDTYVEYGHWDSLRKGLLAGERLQLDLRRMEVAYLEKNRREYELTKRISLRLLDPSALLALQRDGECTFAIPEALFDLDHPGHYLRRIKAVSVTIPAVVGPHVTLGAKLTLLEDVVRLNANLSPGSEYGLEGDTQIYDDDRFRLGYGGVSSIATSTAQADSGLFNLDFRDERLLPFEGSGAISSWRLELPTEVRQFDYDTITDIELQLHYTARDGGQPLRSAAEDDLKHAIWEVLVESEGLTLMLSAKEAFPDAWEKFLHPAAGQEGDPLEIPIVRDQLSHVMRQLEATVESVRLVFVPREGTTPIEAGDLELTAPGENPVTFEISLAGGRYENTVAYPAPVGITDDPWELAPTELEGMTITDPDDVEDLYVLVHLMFAEPS